MPTRLMTRSFAVLAASGLMFSSSLAQERPAAENVTQDQTVFGSALTFDAASLLPKPETSADTGNFDSTATVFFTFRLDDADGLTAAGFALSNRQDANGSPETLATIARTMSADCASVPTKLGATAKKKTKCKPPCNPVDPVCIEFLGGPNLFRVPVDVSLTESVTKGQYILKVSNADTDEVAAQWRITVPDASQ